MAAQLGIAVNIPRPKHFPDRLKEKDRLRIAELLGDNTEVLSSGEARILKSKGIEWTEIARGFVCFVKDFDVYKSFIVVIDLESENAKIVYSNKLSSISHVSTLASTYFIAYQVKSQSMIILKFFSDVETLHFYDVLVDAKKKLEERQANKVKQEMEALHLKSPAFGSTFAESFDDLSDQCSCEICREIFDSSTVVPHNLDCGHTFCKVCIFNDKLRIDQKVKCPKCAKVTYLPDGRVLLKNYALMNIADTLMNSRAEPKFVCESCTEKFTTCALRICTQKDNTVFNKFLCTGCIVDGGYNNADFGKYDSVMKEIREDTRVAVFKLCARVNAKNCSVFAKTKELAIFTGALEKKLPEASIPASAIAQSVLLASKQEADEYLEIVADLASTLIKGCDALEETFDRALDVAKQQFDDLFDDEANVCRQATSL